MEGGEGRRARGAGVVSGYGVSNTISTRTADGGWRVELVLDSDYERDLLDGETFVGLGASESEAGLQASRGYLSAISRLSPEQQKTIEKARPAELDLIGAATSDAIIETEDDNQARQWAGVERQRSRRIE